MSEQTATTNKVVKRSRQGTVLKNKMDKTVVVEMVRRYKHPKYLKFVRRRVRYSAHDEQNECNIGDVVLIEETRPISKNKRWRVKKIVERAVII